MVGSEQEEVGAEHTEGLVDQVSLAALDDDIVAPLLLSPFAQMGETAEAHRSTHAGVEALGDFAEHRSREHFDILLAAHLGIGDLEEIDDGKREEQTDQETDTDDHPLLRGDGGEASGGLTQDAGVD